MAEREEYKKMLTELVQNQMVVLGPNIALDRAKKVTGLKVNNDGQVLDIAGDPQMVLKDLAGKYMDLSGQVAQMTLKALMDKHPQIKGL